MANLAQMNAGENIKEALAYLVEQGYAKHAAEGEPVIREINGETYVFFAGRVERYQKHDEKPAPSVFEAYTLDGLIEWIRRDVNGFFSGEEKCIVNVTSPTCVKVITPCKGVANAAQKLAVCTYDAPQIKFDRYMDNEDFGIMLQTSFVEDENRDLALQVVRSMVEESSEQIADDGISQRVTIKHGAQMMSTIPFKNPAYLRPLRTFTEVNQPDSPFVIRFKEGKQAAIFEADGGAWRVEAVRRIGEYLQTALADSNVVVIA